VRPHLGQADCTLIADRGLAGAPLVRLCQARQWHYLLRVSKTHTCQRAIWARWAAWRPVGHVVVKAGQQ
jgi:hypothetical protein